MDDGNAHQKANFVSHFNPITPVQPSAQK